MLFVFSFVLAWEALNLLVTRQEQPVQARQVSKRFQPHIRLATPFLASAPILVSQQKIGGQNKPVAATPTFITSLVRPLGIAVGNDRNIFTVSDQTFNAVFTKFAPNGAVLTQVPFGNISSLNFGYLNTDPVTGWIVHLWQDGRLQIFNPTNGQNGFILGGQSILGLPIDILSPIYDVNQVRFRSIEGIVPNLAQVGDFVISQSGNQIELFIATLNHTTTRAYILRVRIVATSLTSLLNTNPSSINARVIVASGVPPESVASPPGIRSVCISVYGIAAVSNPSV